MGRKKRQEDEADKDSLVGRRVEKIFQGFGKYAGSVVAYNATRGFYKVVYDDGDREELELHELERILVDVVDNSAPPSGKRGRPSKKREESHAPLLDVLDSKRQKREPSSKQNTPNTRSTEDSICTTRPQLSAQRVKNCDDDAKVDVSFAKECKENNADGQPAVNVQLSSVRSSKRKRQTQEEECGFVPSSTKFTRASSQWAEGRTTRSQNLLQTFDNEASTLDGDELSDCDVESSVDEDDELPSSDKFTLSMVHANAPKEPDLPAVVPLPPSSRNIPLSEDLVVEAFAIYSFLRSFSHALFLSPFCLEDFVCALMSETTNHLIDSMHLILLQALRRHLQRLSKDDCFMASECLRQRDWNLLDNVTWPSFLMVLLTTQGFGKLYGQGIASVGLLDAEYYKASVKVKLAVLSFLCDQVLETEEIRAVLDARELESTRLKDMKYFGGKVTDVTETQQSLVTMDHREKAADDSSQGTNTLAAGFSSVESKPCKEESSSDWNSDECVLCGMNGNLICCDGCPAAYHSRCVGISRASLPPGDWFCPECIVEKVGGEQSSRCMGGLGGSHSLGVDPYGRTFMATCGHLLVLNPSDSTHFSYSYYNKHDISGVLQALEVLKPHCDKVAIAIRQHWEMPAGDSSVSNSSQLVAENMGANLVSSEGGSNSEQHVLTDGQFIVPQHDKSASIDLKERELDTSIPQVLASDANERGLESESLRKLAPDSVDARDGLVLPVVPEQINAFSKAPARFCSADNVSDGVSLQRVASDLNTNLSSSSIPNVLLSVCDSKTSERALETSSTKPLEAALTNTSKAWEGTLASTSKPFEGVPAAASYSARTQHMNNQSFEQDPYLAQKIIGRDSKGRFLTASSREHITPDDFQKSAQREQLYTDHFQRIGFYNNHYVFGDAAATAAANLALMTADPTVLSEKGLKRKTLVTTIAEQINAFSKAPARFCWPNIRKKLMDGPKDRCGWCFSCTSCMKRGCLLNQAASHLAAGAARVAGGIRPGKSGSGHLPAVAGYLLHIEENVHSLLIGPWENMLFRKQWRKRVEQAMSICDVKTALLDLEAHLRSVVLTEDWSKCMEDAPPMVLGGCTTSPLDDSVSKKASSKKISRRSGASKRGLSKSGSTALGTVQWARRGKVAHRVSGWATLSGKVARKAGRQGGFKKITGITYVDGEEVSKRTKQIAWRARVQAARTVAELAVQVRCLDSVLRWDDLVSKVEVRSVSNICEDEDRAEATNIGVHGKRIQDKATLYLIDSTLIPMQGVRQSVSAAQNCKVQQVWVDERQVPLSLLKEFEEKERASRQSEMPKPILLEVRRIVKKDIFKFLWDRAGFSIPTKLVMSITCKFCSLKVLTSLAVQCHLCRAPFHKDCTVASHSVGQLELKYTCCGCLKLTVGHKSTGLNRVKKESNSCSAIQKNADPQQTSNLPSNPKKIVFCQPRPQLTPPSIRLSVKPPSRPQLTPPSIRLSVKPPSSSMKEETNRGGTQVLVRLSDSVPKNLEKTDGVYWRRNGTITRMHLKQNLLFPIAEREYCHENPKCYACKQQYRADLIYIKCEYCILWFHGDAVGVNQSNVSEVVGFKCHRCRKKAVPSCPYGANHRIHKRVAQDSTPSCNFAMRGRVEEVCITKRTPLPLLRAAENQPQQHMALPVSSATPAITSECATVKLELNSDGFQQLVEGSKPLADTQWLVNGPTQMSAVRVQSCLQASKDESQESLGVQNGTDCALQEDSQDLSGADETLVKEEIVIDDSSKNGENSSQPTLSFMELLYSEDDRVEELAEVAMDFGADGFDVFDLDTLMDSFGTSALSSEPEVSLAGDPCQVLDAKSQSVIQSMCVSSDITDEICVVCRDGSPPSDLQCVGCGLAAHQQCLVGESATGVWTSRGWACDACKTGILQSQDVLADRMQLIDSRILLQS